MLTLPPGLADTVPLTGGPPCSTLQPFKAQLLHVLQEAFPDLHLSTMITTSHMWLPGI